MSAAPGRTGDAPGLVTRVGRVARAGRGEGQEVRGVQAIQDSFGLQQGHMYIDWIDGYEMSLCRRFGWDVCVGSSGDRSVGATGVDSGQGGRLERRRSPGDGGDDGRRSWNGEERGVSTMSVFPFATSFEWRNDRRGGRALSLRLGLVAVGLDWNGKLASCGLLLLLRLRLLWLWW